VTPRFHGTFSSYAQNSDAASRDEEANVDLLLMNEPQYAAFAAGHDPDVLLIADTSHYQDIGFDLPPTRDLPVQYHLVFRNSPGGVAKKTGPSGFHGGFLGSAVVVDYPASPPSTLTAARPSAVPMSAGALGRMFTAMGRVIHAT